MLTHCWLCSLGMVVPKFGLAAKATSGKEGRAFVRHYVNIYVLFINFIYKYTLFINIYVNIYVHGYTWAWARHTQEAHACYGVCKIALHVLEWGRLSCISFVSSWSWMICWFFFPQGEERRAGSAWIPNCYQCSLTAIRGCWCIRSGEQ